MRFSRRQGRGAILVEFALLVGTVILPLVTVVFTLGRVIWQIDYLSDVAREAARQGTLLSDVDHNADCGAIAQRAIDLMRERMTSTNRWGLKNVWDNPDAGDATIGPQAAFQNVKGTAVFKVLTTRFSTDDTKERCLFCFASILRGTYNIEVIARQDLHALNLCTVTP